MYLSAHRVLSPDGTRNGINGFLYEHGAIDWIEPPVVETGTVGELVHTFLMVPMPMTDAEANAVQSYVDLVAPDGTNIEDLVSAFIAWLKVEVLKPKPNPLPWKGVVRSMRFELGMNQRYAKEWKFEVARLIGVCRMTMLRATTAITPTVPT